MKRLLRRPLLSLVELWQFAAVVTSVVTVVWIVVRTAQATSEVSSSRHEVDRCIARAVAEQHALLAAVGADAPTEQWCGEYRSRLEVSESAGVREARITVEGGLDSVFEFRCELLPGSLPRALRQPLTIHGSFDRSLVAGIEPAVLTAALSRDVALPAVGRSSPWNLESIGAARRRTFARDDSIALLRARSGTDQVDFVLVPDDDGVVRPRFPAEGLLILEGNLWIDRGRGALQIEIERDATLVVRGNVYLGRSLAVVGGGHLVVAAQHEPGHAWSEGSGRVFVGLPEDEFAPECVVRVDASLVIGDECFVSVRRAQIAGAVVVGGDLRAASADSRLVPAGSRLPDARASQPGIGSVGRPCPGRLELVEGATSDR